MIRSFSNNQMEAVRIMESFSNNQKRPYVAIRSVLDIRKASSRASTRSLCSLVFLESKRFLPMASRRERKAKGPLNRSVGIEKKKEFKNINNRKGQAHWISESIFNEESIDFKERNIDKWQEVGKRNSGTNVPHIMWYTQIFVATTPAARLLCYLTCSLPSLEITNSQKKNSRSQHSHPTHPQTLRILRKSHAQDGFFFFRQSYSCKSMPWNPFLLGKGVFVCLHTRYIC